MEVDKSLVSKEKEETFQTPGSIKVHRNYH